MEAPEQEQWNPVTLPGFSDRYSVSNTGRVRRMRAGWRTNIGKEMSQEITPGGYRRVAFRANNIQRRPFVHRLVAQAFIPNPDEKPDVNHIDGNKTHNHVNNLEWVTKSENAYHAKTLTRVPNTVANELAALRTEVAKLRALLESVYRA
jgi:hypothetical protein